MLDSPQHEFRTTRLDPDLLPTPFRVRTNWHVITGAPCSGKATLIDLLTDKGFQTVPETGRQYMERKMKLTRLPPRPILLCVVPFTERRCSGDISYGPKDVPHPEAHWLDVRKYRATLGIEERSLCSLSGIVWQY